MGIACRVCSFPVTASESGLKSEGLSLSSSSWGRALLLGGTLGGELAKPFSSS